MTDILHDFPIAAPPQAVFDAVSRPRGLDAWWTLTSSGTPAQGNAYELGFGPGYDWSARVTRCIAAREFELEIGRSDADWEGTRVGFTLAEGEGRVTHLRFHHAGWPHANQHYRTSSFCWAMYLRLLRLHLETGETVPYERRLLV